MSSWRDVAGRFVVSFRVGGRLVAVGRDDRAEAWALFMRLGSRPQFSGVTFHVRP